MFYNIDLRNFLAQTLNTSKTRNYVKIKDNIRVQHAKYNKEFGTFLSKDFFYYFLVY